MVFALLAELEERFDLPTGSLGWIAAGAAFVAGLVAQLTVARCADRGYAAVVSGARMVVSPSAWFGLSSELWQLVAA